MLDTRKIPWIAFLAILLLLMSAWFYFGIQIGADSDRYIGRGTNIVDSLINHERHQIQRDGYTLFYLVPNLLAGIGNKFWSESLTTISVLINIICFALMAFLAFRFWVRDCPAKVSTLFLILGIYLIVGLPADVLKYSYVAISSDILAMSFLGVFCYFLGIAVVTESTGHWIGALMLAVLSMATRPSGVIVSIFLVIALLYLILCRRKPGKRGDAYGMILLFIFPTLVVFILWPSLIYLAKQEMAWAKILLDPLPSWVISSYHKGIVVKGVPDTFINPPSTLVDYIVVTINRFVYFIVPLRPGFSVLHTTMNLSYIVVILWMLIAGWRKLRRLGGGHARLAPLLLACSYYFALFYTTLIVLTSRYQLSIWPPIWIVAGYGLLFYEAHISRYFGDSEHKQASSSKSVGKLR